MLILFDLLILFLSIKVVETLIIILQHRARCYGSAMDGLKNDTPSFTMVIS